MLSAALIDTLSKSNEVKDLDLNKRLAELILDQISPLKLDELERDWL